MHLGSQVDPGRSIDIYLEISRPKVVDSSVTFIHDFAIIMRDIFFSSIIETLNDNNSHATSFPSCKYIYFIVKRLCVSRVHIENLIKKKNAISVHRTL